MSSTRRRWPRGSPRTTPITAARFPLAFGGDATADFGSDNAGVAHGTHVAGIVAGNMPEGTEEQFKMDTLGLAPEAQLLIMNIADWEGTIYF